MASSKTNYPKFSSALYELTKVMGEVRQNLIDSAGFSPADTAAFDVLKAAVDIGTAYFPRHTEAT